jgi:hypothetical protein
MPNDLLPQTSGVNRPETGNRRKHRRHPGKAVVHIVRERDFGRTRIPAKLLELSVAGIGLVSAARFETNEQVRVCLQNDIQRITKDVRGVVRWISPTTDEKFRVGIELCVRLSPHDLMSLTRVTTSSELGTSKIWM